MVHEFSRYTILYTIFCRFCGIVWYCIMSFLGMMLANMLNFRNFGMKWNCSVSTVVVPVSPLVIRKYLIYRYLRVLLFASTLRRQWGLIL